MDAKLLLLFVLLFGGFEDSFSVRCYKTVCPTRDCSEKRIQEIVECQSKQCVQTIVEKEVHNRSCGDEVEEEERCSGMAAGVEGEERIFVCVCTGELCNEESILGRVVTYVGANNTRSAGE